jgi:endonuclease/exonuclease/phosphatase family metal-dependent hydrolase
MRKSYLYTFALSIVFLFFFQMAGTLVESIYILDLLNTALDEKALGLFFFFSPVLLLPFRKKIPVWFIWVPFGLLLVARGMTPYLDTTGRMLASGIGTSSVLLLFPVLISCVPKSEPQSRLAIWFSAGLALGVGLSVLLRTVNFSIDYSLTSSGSWAGWGFGLLLGVFLFQLDWEFEAPMRAKSKGVTSAIFGIILVLTLVYFLFSAPGVLARWTEGNYPFIVITVSLMALGWVALILRVPGFISRFSSTGLLIWNLGFALSLVGTILAHRVAFPMTINTPPVVVGNPTWVQQVPLAFTLLLFPVIFLNVGVFIRTILQAAPTPRAFVPGMLLGSLALVLLVFMNIFTNVWGYVEPISPFFRNKFWLPFALITLSLTLLGLVHMQKVPPSKESVRNSLPWRWVLLLGGIFLVTGVSALRTDRVNPIDGDQSSLVLMTYNIQMANDASGNKSYERQLALIRKVSPDILVLQESDSARISLNNNDYVRYFASKLGYYSYYGPTPVSGTYGTAILSRFPLQNPHSVFSYSDQDEIGTAVAEIEVDGRRFTIYNVHPAGSDTAMLAFATTLLARSSDNANVIALGDYNLREGDAAFQMVDAEYINAWTSIYPTGISDDGVDMSGRQRIDHIFISPHLSIRNPVYLLAPESETDHPAHWAEVYWLD